MNADKGIDNPGTGCYKNYGKNEINSREVSRGRAIG